MKCPLSLLVNLATLISKKKKKGLDRDCLENEAKEGSRQPACWDHQKKDLTGQSYVL